MALRGQLLMMAKYNVWATRRLVVAINQLPNNEYHRDTGLFFKSVHDTLNHILLTEHSVWFKRIHDGESPLGYLLSDEIESDRQRLASTLVESAERWVPLLETCSEATLAGTLAFKSGQGQPCQMPFVGVMSHIWNHATHHRGQITAALTRLGRESPGIDLSVMLMEMMDPTLPLETADK